MQNQMKNHWALEPLDRRARQFGLLRHGSNWKQLTVISAFFGWQLVTCILNATLWRAKAPLEAWKQLWRIEAFCGRQISSLISITLAASVIYSLLALLYLHRNSSQWHGLLIQRIKGKVKGQQLKRFSQMISR